MKTKITLKTAIKAKNVLTKKIERFCWEKMKRKLTCFNFVVEKGKKLRWLRWFGWKNLESYVEMVAGLPINEQNK